MKPLLVLLVTSLIALLVIFFVKNQWNFTLAARIGMAAMLVFTAIGHFAFTKGMVLMMPEFLPYKQPLVYATGVLELIAAIGLLVPATTTLTGWFLLIFFLLLLPANIKAAVEHIDYQKATYDGSGSYYLWFRIPLQVLFMVWVYMCAISHALQ
ncbi:DoxX family protein [Fibrella aquatilis]|uniref:DoxX family protein n=1 Tax=Fibrella aquatilis TaxID=2817059 RepID=A0A939JXR2_9BACT|nr:DoxX family protein [Fibrella aquatilis]MBO0933232.1 DoxX family protein [Fibrella aquatilis]